MDHATLARRIREAIFDQAEADGRVMHGDSMDAVIERVLVQHANQPSPADVPLYYWVDAAGHLRCSDPNRLAGRETVLR